MDQGDLQQLWLVRRRFGESRRKELTRSLRNDYLVGWPWGLSFSSHTLSVLTCAPLALRWCASDSLMYPSLNAKLCMAFLAWGGRGGDCTPLGSPAVPRLWPTAGRAGPHQPTPARRRSCASASIRTGVTQRSRPRRGPQRCRQSGRKAQSAHGPRGRCAACCPFCLILALERPLTGCDTHTCTV